MIELINGSPEQIFMLQKTWALILAFMTIYNIASIALIYGKNRHKVKAVVKGAIDQVQKLLDTTLRIIEAVQYKKFARRRLEEEMAIRKLPVVDVEVKPKKVQAKKVAYKKPVRLTIHQELESNPEFLNLLEQYTVAQLRKMAKEKNIRTYNVHGTGKHLNKAEIAALLITI